MSRPSWIRSASEPPQEARPRTVSALSDALPRIGSTAVPSWVKDSESTASVSSPEPPPPKRVSIAPPPPAMMKREELEREIEEARAEAERVGLEIAREKVETLLERYLDAIAELERVTRERSQPDPTDVITLAMVVAREIVRRELRLDPELIIHTLEDAMRSLNGEPMVRIRMGSIDLEAVRKRRPELLEGVEVEKDASLGIGACVVESLQRISDASYERRLEAIGRSLQESLATVDQLKSEPLKKDGS